MSATSAEVSSSWIGEVAEYSKQTRSFEALDGLMWCSIFSFVSVKLTAAMGSFVKGCRSGALWSAAGILVHVVVIATRFAHTRLAH